MKLGAPAIAPRPIGPTSRLGPMGLGGGVVWGSHGVGGHGWARPQAPINPPRAGDPPPTPPGAVIPWELDAIAHS